MTAGTPPEGARPAVEGAQTVRRAMALLRLVATGQEQGLRLADLTLMSGLHRPTVHRLLKVLIDESAVEQDPATRRYRVGPEMLLLGLARPGGLPLRAVADTYLQTLARQIGDTVFLSLRHGTDSVCIARHTGGHPIQVLSIEVGARRPLGASVSGVVLLAGQPPAQARALIQANGVRLAHLGIDAESLERRVQQARRQGYAHAAQGVVNGTSALAVPVHDAAGRLVAAISVAALAARMDRRRLPEVRSSMVEQAQALGRRLHELDAARTRRQR